MSCKADWPPSLTTRELIFGPYRGVGGDWAPRTIRIDGPDKVLHIPTGMVIWNDPAQARLDAWSVPLPCTDDPDLSPTGFTYRVTVGDQAPVTIAWPLGDGSPVHFDTLAAAEASPGVIIYHPPTLPPGGAEGQALIAGPDGPAWSDLPTGIGIDTDGVPYITL